MIRTLFFFVLISIISIKAYGQSINFNKIKTDSTTQVNFVNSTYAPITLKIKKLKDSIPFYVKQGEMICKANDSLENVIFFPKEVVKNDSTFVSGDFIKVSYSIGKELNKDSIKEHLYELPFKKNKRYKIMQGFNGKFSHSTSHSRFAIDFEMPVGDTIVAARSGYVAYTVSHFTERGGKDFIEKANKIIIVHDDGTVANYVHLDTHGVLVNVNDYVIAGQPIGISGFTGYTTKPHLHFVVRNLDESIPIQFGKKKNIGKKSGVWVKN